MRVGRTVTQLRDHELAICHSSRRCTPSLLLHKKRMTLAMSTGLGQFVKSEPDMALRFALIRGEQYRFMGHTETSPAEVVTFGLLPMKRHSGKRRRSCALTATITVDRFIARAPTLMGSAIPQWTKTPAAAGMAITL
jgi:hypothetical protein